MEPKRTSRERAAIMLFVAVLMAMLCMPAAMQAQTRDVITITGAKVGTADADGSFKTGAVSSEHPGVYVIDVGDMPARPKMDDEGYPLYETVTVTLSRPLGATAKRAATVKLGNMRFWGEGETITFLPGETTKTIEIPVNIDPSDYFEDEQGEWRELYTWSGNIPEIFTITTTYADAEYDALILNTNRTDADAPRQSTFATKLEVLQNTYGNDHANYSVTRWGEYILFRFFLATDVKIGTDSRYVINARFADHTNLGPDDDDYGMAQTHEVELHPINAGSVCSEAWYIYRPSPDEYLHSLDINHSGYTDRAVEYPVLEVGPFEVANPAEDAVRYIFYSRADLPEESANTLFGVYLQVDGLMPEFSNVSINKTSFKSGETMVITATMDNWQFVKRCQGGWFSTAFGVTVDDNETLEPTRYTFDEQTGQVTFYVTAPTVTETKSIYVDFGPACRVVEDNMIGDKKVLACPESSFAVSISSEVATPNPITEFDIPGLPADGSLIILNKFEEYLGLGIWNSWVESKQFGIEPVFSPIDATNANQITYAVTNSDGANAEIIYSKFYGILLSTGVNEGSCTFTASVDGEVIFSRSYLLMHKLGEEADLAMPEPLNHINHYDVGTVFPQFQFEFKNTDNRPVDDAVTVKYTHANGTTWTENYSLKALKSRPSNRGSILYDLPFSFTEEHPDVLDDSQIGQPIVTAKVTIGVPTTEGPLAYFDCMSMLESDLKAISFDDYREIEAYSNEWHPVTLTSEVMFLPRIGFTVGYEIPELNIRETYNNLTDGGNVPEWLELQESEFYYTAYITVKSHPDSSTSKYHLYTLAQRSYNPDEVMIRELTTVATLKRVDFEDNIKYMVNGKTATGDLEFDNTTHVTRFLNWFKAKGFIGSRYSDASGGRGVIDSLRVMLKETAAHIAIYDNYFKGAEVTLKCEGDTIQHLKEYNGDFTFMPPTDGKTYTVDVYFPDYGRHYTNTFRSHELNNIYRLFITPKQYIDHLWPYLEFIGATIDFSKYDKRTGVQVFGDLYTEDKTKCYVRQKSNVWWRPALGPRIRVDFSNSGYFKPLLTYDAVPELKLSSSSPFFNAETAWESRIRSNYQFDSMWGRTSHFDIDFNKITAGTTFIDLVDSEGHTINNATINYALADSTMTISGQAGTTEYDEMLQGYQISTDPEQYVEFIEVLAEGYEPSLTAMYLRDYDYANNDKRENVRRYAIVLHKNAGKVGALNLETPKPDGSPKDNVLEATVNYRDLLMAKADETVKFSPTADYADVVKRMDDGKFGSTGWKGLKYAHITGNVLCDNDFNVSQFRLKNDTMNLAPTSCKLITPNEFTTFRNNYCLFDFDVTDRIPVNQTLKAELKYGQETIADLPTLHNNTINLLATAKANTINMEPKATKASDFDDDAIKNGVDMKDTSKAFDKFNLSTPPFLPFTLNIQREDDHFLVRGICTYSFLPDCEATDIADKAENLDWFNETFQECMTAANKAKSQGDDFFATNQYKSSGFVGLKGYLSGIGYVDEKTGKLKVNLYDCGLVYEVSGHVVANLSFFVGSFGVAIDGKLAVLLGLMNRQATYSWGDQTAKPEIDIIIDAQFALKLTAWAEGGIDIWIAKAVGGVRGAGSISTDTRILLPTYEKNAIQSSMAGSKVSLRIGFEAYAEARFLFWTWRSSKVLMDAKKEYFSPDDSTNPFVNPYYNETIFESRNVTKSFKKLKRKVIADLGKPIISNVNGMARPTYLLGGKSLLFNNLKDASDYNDDCLQLFNGSSSTNLLNTGIEAPMYDFSVAKGANKEMVVFEQVKDPINKKELEAKSDQEQTKEVSENIDIYVGIHDGGNWQYENLTQDVYEMACVNPVVAIQDDGKAVALWQQGKAKFNNNGERYIDGSMMLRRYDGSSWGEPVEVKRLNRRNVPADYQVSMKEDSILVLMTLQQDVNNENKQTSILYVSIDPDDKVRERYTLSEGSKPQMVHINGVNLVGYLSHESDGRDVTLRTVNMKGEPTGKVFGSLGMQKRMVNNFRIVVDDDATNLDDVSLLWNQSDQESTTDPETGAANVTFKNRIYTSKLCSHDKLLYFSTPVEIATMPDDVSLVSMDGYLDGLDMKVAYCVANDNDGAAVLETPVAFTNHIEHKISYDPHEVSNENMIPVTLTVVNDGFELINKIEVVLGDTTYVHDVMLMPQESINLTDDYPVRANFNGTIDYDVAANFIPANSNSLKIRRMAGQRPHRVQQSGTQDDVRQVDIALKVLSKRTGADGKTTIVAEVDNVSLLPISEGVSVKVGLYPTPVPNVIAAGTTEVTVNYEDLYDEVNKKNRVKIVSLTADQPLKNQTLYLRTTPMKNGKALTDVRPSNNVLPISLMGRHLKGDVNLDGSVDVADIASIITVMAGNTTNIPAEQADVNEDGQTDVADIAAVISIMAARARMAKPTIK